MCLVECDPISLIKNCSKSKFKVYLWYDLIFYSITCVATTLNVYLTLYESTFLDTGDRQDLG